MAELPKSEVEIVNPNDVTDWRYRALVFFPDETIPVELRMDGEMRSPIKPSDRDSSDEKVRNQYEEQYEGWVALINSAFRRRLLDNRRPVVDQVWEWAQGGPIDIYLFE